MAGLLPLIWDWLLSGLDATRAHEITSVQSWHGRFMTLAWGICVPLGILIARYVKITPGQNWPDELDNQFWWRSHLFFQITAAVCLVIGLLVMLIGQGFQIKGLHPLLGWLVILGAASQILSGLLRGSKGGPTEAVLVGDHYSMTRRRRIFEAFHKSMGYVLLFGGAVLVLQGLWSVNAPRWMYILLTGFWLCLGVMALVLRNRLQFVTSYQAIWGPDPDHPGNRDAKF